MDGVAQAVSSAASSSALLLALLRDRDGLGCDDIDLLLNLLFTLAVQGDGVGQLLRGDGHRGGMLGLQLGDGGIGSPAAHGPGRTGDEAEGEDGDGQAAAANGKPDHRRPHAAANADRPLPAM